MGGTQYTAAVQCATSTKFNQIWFICVTPDGTAEVRPKQESGTTMEIRYRGNGDITIRSIHGGYLSAQPNGQINFQAWEAKEWEIFKVEGWGWGRLNLRSYHGKYLGFDKNGVIACNKTEAQHFELFLAVKPLQKFDTKQQLSDPMPENYSKPESVDEKSALRQELNQTLQVDDLEGQQSTKYKETDRKVHPQVDKDPEDTNNSTYECGTLWKVSDEILEGADMYCIILLISLFSHQPQKTQEERLELSKLIEVLCSFEELQNMDTEGKTTKEFEELAELFHPLDQLWLDNPPANLHKLYRIFWVKINDIQTLNLDTKIPSARFEDSCKPNPVLYESKYSEGIKVNVDYYCSLI